MSVMLKVSSPEGIGACAAVARIAWNAACTERASSPSPYLPAAKPLNSQSIRSNCAPNPR
jgi:hypothetical protein